MVTCYENPIELLEYPKDSEPIWNESRNKVGVWCKVKS